MPISPKTVQAQPRGLPKKSLAATVRLEQFPQSGRRGRSKGTRELVVVGLPYIMAYRVVQDAILILHVIHTSRQWPKKL